MALWFKGDAKQRLRVSRDKTGNDSHTLIYHMNNHLYSQHLYLLLKLMTCPGTVLSLGLNSSHRFSTLVCR